VTFWQGVLLFFCGHGDIHGGLVGRVRENSTTFPYKKFFCTADPFPGTKFGQIWWGNFLARGKSTGAGVCMKKIRYGCGIYFPLISGLILVGREKNTFGIICYNILKDTKKRNF